MRFRGHCDCCGRWVGNGKAAQWISLRKEFHRSRRYGNKRQRAMQDGWTDFKVATPRKDES